MGWCLTPAPWSNHQYRREAFFQRDATTFGAVDCEREAAERAAVAAAWRRDFGGRTFLEPVSRRVYCLFVRRHGHREALMVLDDRWEAIDLHNALADHGYDVSIDVRRRVEP